VGGYAPSDLQPELAANQRSFIVAIGDDGVERPYAITKIHTERAYSYGLSLEGLDLSVPY
jgi:hypothetical protein